MIHAKPLDRAISNIKYRLGKYYVRMGLTPLHKVRECRDFSNSPLPRDPYVINKQPLTPEENPKKPQLGGHLKSVRPDIPSNGVPYLKMKSIGQHNTSQIMKESEVKTYKSRGRKVLYNKYSSFHFHPQHFPRNFVYLFVLLLNVRLCNTYVQYI